MRLKSGKHGHLLISSLIVILKALRNGEYDDKFSVLCTVHVVDVWVGYLSHRVSPSPLMIDINFLNLFPREFSKRIKFLYLSIAQLSFLNSLTTKPRKS